MTLDTVDLVNHRLAADLDEAFPDLIRETQHGIYSGIRRLVPSAADAEDLAQETFIRAYRALSAYSTERVLELKLRSWLWTIALNLCRNAARTRSRRPRTVVLDRDAVAPGSGPEAEALAADENARWAGILGRLPAAQHHAVVLRHVVGLTYSEISAVTGRPEGTVKADVHRGIAKLQEASHDR